MEKRNCKRCEEEFEIGKFSNKYNKLCRDCTREYHRTYRKERSQREPEFKEYIDRQRRFYMRKRLIVTKEKLLSEFGGRCKKCDIADYRVLQLDHINGGGGKSRKNGEFKSTRQFFKEVLSDPGKFQKYQILCANCNWIKRIENGEIRRLEKGEIKSSTTWKEWCKIQGWEYGWGN